MDLYAAADVYVSPSREDSFGLPVAEAMACGLPVISSVFAGVSALIHKEIDGFVVLDPDDSAALAELFTRLHGNEALRRQIGQAATTTARNWSWDQCTAELFELLKQAAKRNTTN